MKRILALSALLLAPLASLHAASPGMAVEPDYFDDAYIKATMVKVAQWQLRQPTRLAPRGADQGVFHTGLFAAYQAMGNACLLAAVISMGETNQWKPGPKLMFPDHHIILNPYIELFRLRKEPRMIQPAAEFVEAYLKSPANDTQNRLITWWLCDYLFMDPPVLAKLGLMLKRPALLAKNDAMWHECYDLLFDKQRDLFDVSPKNTVYRGFNGIKPGEREANGEKIFWGCGNGWVLGGLALLLKELPADYKERPFYEDVFKRLARSIVLLQQSDGLWRASLLDPPAYPRAESTGSALFTYGLAYGINAGLLPRADYETAVKKAWAGLNSICLQPDFRIGWSEGSVARPVKNYNQDSAHWLSAGAYLLAGSEVLNCAFVPRANRNQGSP